MSTRITKEQAIDLVNRGILKPDVLEAFNEPQSWNSVSREQLTQRLSQKTNPKQNKYHNKKVYEFEDGFVGYDKDDTTHGKLIYTFDSEKEYKRWNTLRMLERAGGIEQLERQKRFTLQDSFKIDGQTIRAITYLADFYYLNKKDGVYVVEDIKGGKATQTEAFKIKRKMFLYRYPDIKFIVLGEVKDENKS